MGRSSSDVGFFRVVDSSRRRRCFKQAVLYEGNVGPDPPRQVGAACFGHLHAERPGWQRWCEGRSRWPADVASEQEGGEGTFGPFCSNGASTTLFPVPDVASN